MTIRVVCLLLVFWLMQAFLCSQTVLALTFRSQVTPQQLLGAAIIFVGILLLAVGAPRPVPNGIGI